MVNDVVNSVSNILPGKQAAPQEVSFLARMKHYLNPKQLVETLSLSKDKIMEMGLYLGVGFLSGFLLKKYSKYVLMVLLCMAGLVVLQQFEIVTIVFNTAKIQEVFGVKPSSLEADLFSVYWNWIKINFSIVLSFSIGFLVGLKVA